MTKEQENLDTRIEPSNSPLVCMDCANHLIMDGRVLVKYSEYHRLKRLEENIQKTLTTLKNVIAGENFEGNEDEKVANTLLAELILPILENIAK